MAHRNRFRSYRKYILMLLLFPLIYTLRCMFSKPPAKSVPVMSRNLENVVVHIDFKGSPVRLTYLEKLLPKLRSLGVTGLLMEYEDMFPYEGDLENLSARNCYDRDELKLFLKTAVSRGFDIIPLVQTFGHMEHALKLPEFAHLRETAFYPDSLCPSNPKSVALVRDILTQIIKFHEEIFPLRYIHIGCDEVYHINECQTCKGENRQDYEIFLRHMQVVKNMVHKQTPGAVVLIWDDMLRNIPIDLWQAFDAQGVEPVYWDYASIISVSHINMMKYHKKFKNLWIASAFKGADGRTTTFPDLLKRFYNHYGWMMFMTNYKFGGENDVYRFSGIILTGWSRYSHMDPPCDLLQVSVPSLFLNLLFIKWSSKNGDQLLTTDVNDIFNYHIHRDFTKEINCSDLINLEYFDDRLCVFDGSHVYRALSRCDDLVAEIHSYLNNIDNGLLSINYYSKLNFINRNRVVDHIKWCNSTLRDLLSVEKNIINTVEEYYDEHFVKEYINFKLYDIKVVLLSIFESFQNMLLNETWDRRPFI